MARHPEWGSSLDPRHWADVMNQRMNALKPVSDSYVGFYQSMPEDVQKKLVMNRRIRKVHSQFSQVVDPFILEHTNSVYLLRHKDLLDSVREEEIFDLVVYVDNSLIAAELNARRELICLKYREQFNIAIDTFEIRISRGHYKERYPFKNITDSSKIEKASLHELSQEEINQINEIVKDMPEGKLKGSFIRAISAQKRKYGGIL